jgi:hypothetical protein
MSSETAWSQPEDDPDFVEMDVAVTDEERSDSEVEATADGAVWNDITHGDTSMHLVTGETELEVIYSDVASRTAIGKGAAVLYTINDVTVAVSQHEHYAFRPPELDFYNLYEFVGITDIVPLVSPRRGRGRQCRVVANARDSTQEPVADEVKADMNGDIYM